MQHTCKCQMQASQDSRSLEEKGYFGKSSKPRELQPSMFQILTWDYIQYSVPHCEKNNERVLINKRQQANLQQEKVEQIREVNLKDAQQNNRKNSVKNIGSPYKTKQSIINSRKRFNETDEINQRTSDKEKENRSIRHETKKVLETSKSYQKRNRTQNHSYDEKQQKNLEKFRQTTRWLPNSAFTTYYGKPAFENYGCGNVSPTNGGLLYGNYLKTHNVQPHRGGNRPKNLESYSTALRKAEQMGPIYPYPPKTVAEQQLSNCLSQQQIYPTKNNHESMEIVSPDLSKIQKFGGPGLKKVRRTHITYC